MLSSLDTWSALEEAADQQGWGPAQRHAAAFRASSRDFEGTARETGLGSVVLWRDTFGWCPFCLPTQLLLEDKRIPYTTRKVPLKSYMYGEKPADFLQRVSNALVPDLGLDYGTSSERTILPKEGFDLLPVIEELFPKPSMAVPPGDDAKRRSDVYLQQSVALQEAVRSYATAGSAHRLLCARIQLIDVLNTVEASLADSPEGPYLFGEQMSIPDYTFIPWVERADVVPRFFRCDEILLAGPFPRIMCWLESLRARPTYSNLRLDDESLAVSVQNALAFFHKEHHAFNFAKGQIVPPDDQLAGLLEDRGPGSPAAVEAGHALVYCRDGILELAAHPPLDTQKHVAERIAEKGGRMSQTESNTASLTDAVLRFLAAYLLQTDPTGMELSSVRCLVGKEEDDNDTLQIARGLIFLRNRIQVPRDMSTPAAATLRTALLDVAQIFVGEEMVKELMLQHEGAYLSIRDIRSRY